MKRTTLTIPMLAAMALIAGCESSDDRLARFAEKANAQQAQQNRTVTELNREAVESHRRVIETTEQSRQEVASLERDLQLQRDRLEDERRSLADLRQRDSLLAPVLESIGVLLVCGLPLVLAWYLLHGIRGNEEDVSEVLIREFANESPWLIDSNDRRRESEREAPRLGQDRTGSEQAD